MLDIALVTYQKLLALSQSDQLLVAPLAQQGIHSVTVSWDDPDVDWQQFEAVILRSHWDYHHRPEEFRQWVTKLNTLNVPLHNSPQTVLWNMEKPIYVNWQNTVFAPFPPSGSAKTKSRV